MNEKDLILKIAKDIDFLGGRVYYVGGYVRDEIIGKENKDIDVEIYNITPEQLKSILSKYGVVDEVGSSFGILMIHGVDIDFAMPRKEIKIREGHRGFSISVDPFMSTYEASKRRDFTINSIMKDVITGEVVDHFGGMVDLKKRVIRHIDDSSFIEDPLRVLRACQFASRFCFDVAPDTLTLCKNIDISQLPKERIFEEVKKALLKSDKPSIAFETMREINVIDKLFPELSVLIDCPQSPKHHPEGDVWIHTMKVIDELSKLKYKSKDQLTLMLSGLCHDLGKPIVTKEEDGKISSPMHDKIGVEVTKKFLKRITNEKLLIKNISNMVENHMRPNLIALNGTNKAVRKLMVDTDIKEILLLSEADHRGRGISENEKDYTNINEWFMQKIEDLSSNNGKIEALVLGRDLIELGFKPGKEMGELIKRAFNLQIEGLNKEEILRKIKEEVA